MAINIDQFITTLEQEVSDYQVPVVDLIVVQTNDPYRILVATILSARTRDEVTAKSSARLFKEAPDLGADDIILINQSGRGDKDIFTVADAYSDQQWSQFIQKKAEEYGAEFVS